MRAALRRRRRKINICICAPLSRRGLSQRLSIIFCYSGQHNWYHPRLLSVSKHPHQLLQNSPIPPCRHDPCSHRHCHTHRCRPKPPCGGRNNPPLPPPVSLIAPPPSCPPSPRPCLPIS